jgi:hypothetical protein
MTIPPRYRGAFDQRLQTRGGERWPGHDLASEMRCKGPAVQAALVPACPPGTPRACDGRQAVLPSQERCLKCLGLVTVGCHAEVSPSRGRNDYRGGRGANLKHRARDALGLADLRHALPIARTRVKGEAHRTSTSLDVARRRGPAGPFGPLASRAPSVRGGRQKTKEDGPARGLDKEYGRWRLGLRDCLASSLQGWRQARTGNTCDCLATVLEHLSHTPQWHQRRRDSAIPFNDMGAR